MSDEEFKLPPSPDSPVVHNGTQNGLSPQFSEPAFSTLPDSVAATANETVRKAREAAIENMDYLDTIPPTDRYSVKVGSNRDGVDMRAFIMPMEEPQVEGFRDFLVLTADGPQRLRLNNRDAEQKVSEFVSSAIDYPELLQETDHPTGAYHPGVGALSLAPSVIRGKKLEDAYSFNREKDVGVGYLEPIEDVNLVRDTIKKNQSMVDKRKTDKKLTAEAEKQISMGEEIGKVIRGS